jgi:hypothetical protein
METTVSARQRNRASTACIACRKSRIRVGLKLIQGCFVANKSHSALLTQLNAIVRRVLRITQSVFSIPKMDVKGTTNSVFVVLLYVAKDL